MEEAWSVPDGEVAVPDLTLTFLDALEVSVRGRAAAHGLGTTAAGPRCRVP